MEKVSHCLSPEKLEELMKQLDKEEYHGSKKLIDRILSGDTPIEENNKYVLPISTKDHQLPQKALNLKAFLCFAMWSVLNIPPEHHAALLLLCGSFLGYQVKTLGSPFDFQHGVSTKGSQFLLSCKEGFENFLPEMAHITKFLLCYLLTLILVWPLQPGVQIFVILLVLSAPLYYFPDLAQKASGVDVACGSFKLPLIWFATLGAFGLSIICGFLTLLMVYFSWRHMYEKGSKVKEFKVGLEDLKEILQA